MGGCAVTSYPQVSDMLEPGRRVALPRAPRLVVPGGTVHVVARSNNREFYFITPEDFPVWCPVPFDGVSTSGIAKALARAERGEAH